MSFLKRLLCVAVHFGASVLVCGSVSAYSLGCVQLFLESSRCFLEAGSLQHHLTSNRFAALVALQLKAVELFLALRSIARRARENNEERSCLISQLLNKARPEPQSAPAYLASYRGVLAREDVAGQGLLREDKPRCYKIVEEAERLLDTRARLRLGDVVQSLLFELSCGECMLQSHGGGDGVTSPACMVPEQIRLQFGQEEFFESGPCEDFDCRDGRSRSKRASFLESQTKPPRSEKTAEEGRHTDTHLGGFQSQSGQERPFAALAAAAAGVGEKRELVGAQKSASNCKETRRPRGLVVEKEAKSTAAKAEEDKVEEEQKEDRDETDKREENNEELSMSAFMDQSVTGDGRGPLPFRVIHLSLKDVLLFIEVHPDAVASIIVSNVSHRISRARRPFILYGKARRSTLFRGATRRPAKVKFRPSNHLGFRALRDTRGSCC